MFRSVFILYIILISSIPLKAQKIVDINDSTRISYLLNSSEAVYLRNLDSAKLLNLQAIDLIKKSLVKNKHLSEKHKFILELHSNYSAALNNVGYLELQQGKIEEGIKKYHLAIEESYRANDEISIAVSYNNLGYINFQQGRIEVAQDYYQKSLNLNEKHKNYSDWCTALCNMAYLMETIGDKKLAVNYYEKALETSQKGNEKRVEATVLNNLAFMYRESGDFKKATELFSNSMKLFQELGDDVGIGTGYVNLGKISFDNNIMPLALNHFLKALPYFEKANDPAGMASAYECMARTYHKMGKYNEGIDAGQRALKLSSEIGFTEDISKSAYGLYLLYQSKGNFKKALEMHVMHKELEDSIRSKEIHDKALREQMQYEFVKKQTEDSVKHAQANKIKDAQLAEQDARLQRDKVLKLAMFGGLSLMVVLAFVIFRAYRTKQKANAAILAQKKEVEQQKLLIEEKNKEIIDSIHYAKRIQQALLPNEKYIARSINKKREK